MRAGFALRLRAAGRPFGGDPEGPALRPRVTRPTDARSPQPLPGSASQGPGSCHRARRNARPRRRRRECRSGRCSRSVPRGRDLPSGVGMPTRSVGEIALDEARFSRGNGHRAPDGADARRARGRAAPTQLPSSSSPSGCAPNADCTAPLKTSSPWGCGRQLSTRRGTPGLTASRTLPPAVMDAATSAGGLRRGDAPAAPARLAGQ